MNFGCAISGETTETIGFRCEAPDAHSVFLIGDFNSWNHTSDPMRRQDDGSWFLEVPLCCGHHYYQFLVDTKPVLDPHAMCHILKDRHEKVSLIALT